MELEAVVGAVVELGDRLGVPMPATRAVYACAKMLDEKRRRTRVNIHNRWFQLVASVIAMIMIANLQYAWTLFVKPMQQAPAGSCRTSSGRSRCSSCFRPGCSRAGMADRSPGPARASSAPPACCAASAGRASATPRRCRCSTRSTRRRHRRGVRLQRLHRVGAEVVHEGARARGRHHRGRLRRRHGALHSVHRLDDSASAATRRRSSPPASSRAS